MSRYFKLFLFVFSCLMASCAKSTYDNDNIYQNISVSALVNNNDDVHAKCNIKHNNFTYYDAEAPFTMRVRKSHHPLYIICHHNGLSSKMTKIIAQDANQYDSAYVPRTTTRWYNARRRNDWLYPSLINITINDFANFYDHRDYYPDKTVPAWIILSKNSHISD